MKSSIGIGFVGAGWMGSTLLKRLVERDDVHIAALYGRTQDNAQAVLQGLGLSQELYTNDYEALLQNPDVDAVFICSTNGAHGEQSIRAMEAGKHVFCEKPCATRYADYLKQIELERANPHLITFVDYLLNFDSMETQLKQRIADGEFGQVSQIQVNYRHPVNIEGDKRWKLSQEDMGDAIGMGIIHSLSVMVNVMAAQTKPVSVYARGQQALVRPFEPDAIWSIVIGFDNGATGMCLGNIDTANGYDAYHNVQGTEGAFIFDSLLDRPQKIRMWSEHTTEGKWIYPLDPERCAKEGAAAWPDDTTTPDSGDVMNHQTHRCVAHFIACIKTGTPSPLSFANSASIAEIGWAALISAKIDRPVPLPINEEHAVKFFDLQVNGYAGIDFNRDALTGEELEIACALLSEHGAEGVLATVITASINAMVNKLARLASFQRAPITGIHIEGPFLSPEPGYIGAHPARHAGPADLDSMKRLLEAARGLTRIVTLAPEQDVGGQVTRFLSEQGIVVSAGHCNPSLDQLKQSIDNGLTLFTHLGNGCPGALPRHDNIIQRVLSLSDQLQICYIADGAHVPYLALKNYLALSGMDRSIVVTDAISAAGLGPGTYTLGDQTVEVGDDGVVWSADRSHFVGSACTMPQTAQRLATELSLSPPEIKKLIYTNPKQVMVSAS